MLSGHPIPADRRLGRIDLVVLAVLMLVFWCGVLRQIELPGLYMDSVFPDYLAARILNPDLKNPVWALPTATIPILGGLYHGVQNLYVDLAAFSVLGISVTSVRIAQALFGAAIVVCLYALVVRLTGQRVAACVGALLLATDIAFLASFRTQFYIILGAQAWLFASLLGLWRGGRLGYFLSGACFGLAVYGYFVLGFFLPAMITLIATLPERRPLDWTVGLAVGLLPYVAGYASLIWALGGWTNAAQWLGDAVHSLAPFSSKPGVWENLAGVWQRTALALSNAGNEFMILGEPLGGAWPEAKVYLLVAVVLAATLASLRWHDLRLAILPLTYVAVAAVFGSRLWVHHFVVLVPLAYLVMAVAVGQLPKRRASQLAIAAGAFFFLAGNLYQANRFHEALNTTGGVRMASNALSLLAEEARRARRALYVFPDWGFLAPFALLTENKVPYVLDVAAIPSGGENADLVMIAFWNDRDEEKYREALRQAGAAQLLTVTYRQRDGRTAFTVVQGQFR